MTIEEYKLMERQAMEALQRARESVVSADIGILMNREVYETAKSEGSPAYAVSVQNFHELYWGHEIYVINEDVPRIFAPAIIRFSENCDLRKSDAGGFLVSGSHDGTLHLYARSTLEPVFFRDTGLTVHQANRTERMTSEDQVCAGEGQGLWQREYVGRYMPSLDLEQYVPQLTVYELRKELDEVLSSLQKPLLSKRWKKNPPQTAKAPPVKDWDERITPEDTKELDEFLNSLAGKGVLEPAT